MSQMLEENENTQLILVAGESTMGKSASLMNIRNQENWLYLNTESGKRLPFPNKFDRHVITDPYQVHDGFEHGIDTPEIEGIIVDSLTFLMDMFESQYVVPAADGRSAWQDYQQFFKKIMQQYVPLFNRPVIFTAHTRTDLDDISQTMKTAVPIKGALRGVGIESFFSTIVAAKVMPLKTLEDYKNDMLTVTDDDKITDLKHVFQTRHTKKTSGERIRSPIGFFSIKETFINNDCQMLLDHLNKLYNQ